MLVTFNYFIKSMLIAATTTPVLIFRHPTFAAFAILTRKKINPYSATHTIMHIHGKANRQHQV